MAWVTSTCNSPNETKKKKKQQRLLISSSPNLVVVLLVLSLCLLPICVLGGKRREPQPQQQQQRKLRFGSTTGEFKILQVADMHYADGKSTTCLDVLPSQFRGCSDLNTSAFIHRMILAEKPDLIVFTGTLLLFATVLFLFCFLLPRNA